MTSRISARARVGTITVLLGLLALRMAFAGSDQPVSSDPSSSASDVDDAVQRGTSVLYRQTFHPAEAGEESAVPITITKDVGADAVDIDMPSVGGVITGDVLGDDTPLAGVVVEARSGALVVAALTDALGHFEIEGVPAGAVRVRFSTDHWLSDGRSYESLFYGGSRRSAEAVLVAVVNAERTELDPMILPHGATLSGQVRLGTEDAVTDAEVTILGDGESWSTRTDQDGFFLQGGLPASTFRIFVDPGSPLLNEYYGGARELEGAAELSLAMGEERTGVDVVVDPGGEIRGQIRSEGTNDPQSGFEVLLLLRGGAPVQSVNTDNLGFYEHVGLSAGEYFVFVPRMHRYFPSAPTEAQGRAVTVAEGQVRSRIDVTGPDLGGCAVPAGQQGVITGNVRGDFSRVIDATLRAFSDSDTIDLTLTEEGRYHLGCLPEGEYRVVLIPRGTLRTQYHPKVHDPAQASLVFVDSDTSMAVDFDLEKTSWIAGTIRDASTHAAIPGARVTARSSSGVQAEANADEDGRYLIDRLPDGSGLPAGTYVVEADSTLIPDADVTPVLQPWMAVTGGPTAVVRWELPAGFEWRYEVSRTVWASSNVAPPASLQLGETGIHEVAAGVLYDRPIPGWYVYRLEAATTADERFFIETDPVEIGIGGNLLARPNPWTGSGSVEFAAPQGEVNGNSLEILDVAGRVVFRSEWNGNATPAWDGRGSSGVLLPSGVYFLRQVDSLGRERATGELRIVR